MDAGEFSLDVGWGESIAAGGQGLFSKPPCREIVAAILLHAGKIALFKRSQLVMGDQGRWHCITGFLSTGQPLQHVMAEIAEETGIADNRLRLLGQSDIELPANDGAPWRVNAFLFETPSQHLRLNWENDAYQWLELDDIGRLNPVEWLYDIMDSLPLECIAA